MISLNCNAALLATEANQYFTKRSELDAPLNMYNGKRAVRSHSGWHFIFKAAAFHSHPLFNVIGVPFSIQSTSHGGT